MSILDRIVDDTRRLVASRKRETPVRMLEERPMFSRRTTDFRAALNGPELAFIAEIKKASPSKGLIRPDFNPPAIAARYTQGGAAAISVLTEPLHFLGDLDYLSAVREVTDLPLLRKDFIIDPYQLIEARAAGADAVLLIAAILEKSQLFDLHQTAASLGLACLVEVYEASEIDRIDFDQVSILGVNNRNLHTFNVDLSHAPNVFSQAPAGVVRVAESGIHTAEDLAYLKEHDSDAVLIGETLMRAKDPGALLASFYASVNEPTRQPS